MKREDQIKICRTCKHRKLNMNTGLFCGLTGHDPDFETQCGNLEIDEQEAARIKQVEHDVKIEERNEKRKAALASFMLFGVGGLFGAWAGKSFVGAICFCLFFCPIIWFLSGIHYFIGIPISIVYLSLLLLIGILSIIAYKKEQDNTIPLGTTFWIIIVLSTVFQVLAELIAIGRVCSIWFIVLNVVCASLVIWQLYFTDNMRERFPKSSWKWHMLEKIVLAVVSALFIVLLLLVITNN